MRELAAVHEPSPGARLNCAGQGCKERERCRRFRIRLSDGKVLVGEQEVTVFRWASFDIEQAVFGDCESFVRFRP